MSRFMPRPWPVARDDVVRRWRYLWRDLMFCAPMWDAGSGVANEYVHGLQGSLLNGAASKDDVYGRSLSTDGSNDVVDWGTRSRTDVDFSAASHAVCMLFLATNGGTQGTLVSKRDSGTVEMQLFLEAGILKWKQSDGTDRNLIGTYPVNGSWNSVGINIDGTTFSGFLNGAINTPVTGVGVTRRDVNFSMGARWGGYPTTGFPQNGRFGPVYIVRRPMIQSEFIDLWLDPYGPVTRQRIFALRAPAAAGGTTVIPPHLMIGAA